MKKLKLDRRSNAEKKFDEKLEMYVECASSLEDLEAVAGLLKDRSELEKKHRVSPDAIAVVAGNLLGIALILGYEKSNIITTKALGFVLRGRV